VENKSRKFFIFFFLLVLGSVAYSYYVFIVKENFEIFTDEAMFNEALLEE